MKESYYFLHEKFTLDANQWGFLIGITGFILTIIGLFFALYMYSKQRKDQASDAYALFVEASGVMTKELDFAKGQLLAFKQMTQQSGGLVQLSFFSVHISDNFLLKICSAPLVRYFSVDPIKSQLFDTFQIQLFALGEYASYFSQQMHFIERTYSEVEKEFNVVKFLRISSHHHKVEYQEVTQVEHYLRAFVTDMVKDHQVFEFQGDKATRIKDLERFNTQYVTKLKQQLYPFIQHSEKANDMVVLLEQCQSAHEHMQGLRQQALFIVEELDQRIQKVDQLTAGLIK